MARDRRLRDGEWFYVAQKRGRTIHGCCDCGAIHVLQARVTRDGRVQIAATRDDALTARVRRRFRKRRG